MASFKIARGLSTKLPTTKVDGALYFCTDTHELYIDYKNSNNTIVRVGINASQLEGATLAQELKNSTSEIPSSALISSIKSTLENSIAGVSSSLSTHTANKSNPHGVTKSQVGLGNVNNTSDANKPVSTAQATAIANAKTEALNASSAVSEALSAHTSNKNNPHGVTLSQLGGQSAITGAASTVTDSNLTASRVLVSNSSGKIAASSSITTTELGYLDGVTSKIQTQLDSKASNEALLAHIADTDNPHSVTKDQVGLGNVDNTSDRDKPVSSAQRIAIAEAEERMRENRDTIYNILTTHREDNNNPHSVTKAQIGLGDVENKSSATIRDELTKSNVTTALGYTPPTTDTATTTSDGLMSLEDKAKLDYTNIAYGTCDTAARTAAKVVTLTGNDNWELKVGSVIVVKFSVTNTASRPTLNVNGTGAKSIWYNNAVYTSDSSYGGYAKRHIIYVFDGTYWVFIGWGYDSNTDTKVTQSFTTSNGDYPVVLAYTTSTTSETANAVKKNLDFVYNPAQGELKVPTVIADEFVGKLTGNTDTATSATKATQDASGNIITSTYETKGDATSKLSEAKSYADSVATTAANTVKNDLLNGAGAAYDTLKELGELIDDNKDAIAALNEIAAGKANATHTHGNITNAGAIGTAANKAVITTTNGVLTAGTVPVTAGGTGATTAAAALINLGLTATAAELNKMDGVTATTAEINHLDGVTSPIQTQLDERALLTHASRHKTGGADAIAPADIGAFGVVGAITSGADLNDYKEIGAYAATSSVITSLTNCPVASGASQLYVFRAQNSDIAPLIQLFATSATNSVDLFVRKHANGSWSVWKTLATTDYAVNKAGDTMTGNLTLEKTGGIAMYLNEKTTGNTGQYVLQQGGAALLSATLGGELRGISFRNSGDTSNDFRYHEGSNNYNILHTGNLTDYVVNVNPNLLDNWYFVNPINHRGVSSHAGNTYGIDRWKLLTSSGNVEVTSEGLVLSGTNSRFGQPIMNPEYLSGKTLTLSFLLKNTSGASGGFGYLKRINGSWGNNGLNIADGLFSQTFTLNEGITDLDVGMYTASTFAGSVTIVAAKLELGTQQTLAHKDANGNWVLNEIPDYNEQLLRCCMSTADSSDTYANQKTTVINACSANYDMDVVLTSGRHFAMYETNNLTLGTPYAKGVTGSSVCTILSFANSAEYGYQFAFMSGNIPYVRYLTAAKGITAWSSLATTDYAVPLDGSKAMTGNLTVSKTSPYLYLKNTSTTRTARMASTSDKYLSLYNEVTADASNNRTALWLGPETSSLTNLLSINHVVNGTANTYKVLHTGNSNKTKLVSTVTTPTVNNEINWVYE